MIAFTDVHYRTIGDAGTAACAAAVCADGWTAQFPSAIRANLLTSVADYVPGEFWQRELPCLRSVLDGLRPELVVVDGYVWLDADGRKGLGAHLWEALGVPVVGVAKTAFHGSDHAVVALRGTSQRPLWVTAAGVDPARAAEHVRAMHGPHRLPTLLQLADQVAREGRAR